MVDEIKDIKMEQKSTDYISETEASLARNNQMTMLGYTVYNVVLLLCYLLEVIKKSRTVGYYLAFSALSLLPLLFMFVIYNKNKSSKYIRTIMAAGYCVFYSFTVFTTVSPVAFVYGVLISLLIIQYANVFSSTICGIGMLVINIINVIVMGINGDIKSADLPNVEIRIGFTALYALFMVWVTKTLIKNNQAKISQVDQEKDNIASVLSQTMRISDGMINNISIVSEKIATLEESVDKTKISMEEVSSGTTDTSESVQKQLLMTEDIQNYIKLVGDVSDSINEDMEHANSEVSAGKRSIDDLINQVKASENASSKAADELTKLTSYATQMQGIVEIIENITSQTSLLSLNASIEAARVGEAGKGFAVVASEISNLADQTQTATVDIAELITNISAELDEVVKVINILIENNKLQATAANATAVNFEAVAERTGDITAKTEELSSLITELESSNGEIVDSIQTISSATEEVNAHATETLESSEENSMIVEDVRNMVVELQKYAESLTALEN